MPYSGLAAGQRTSLAFKASNTDTSIPTANRPANKGSWPVLVHATSSQGSADRNVTMNLVPTYAVQRAAVAPTINGVRGASEYPGEPIIVDTIWDGTPMGGTNPTISCKTWITHDDANFYLFLQVKDDIRGTILPKEDNKRQRRTDSVEIYFDPRGIAGNTAQTFIGGIFPSMDSMTGAPGVGRDRDNWQGEAHITAPGMQVAVVMASTTAAYTGYDMEVKIPFAVLPDNLDPRHVGFNVVVNDSDTQDKAAQNRVGWSTFPGMRADPWRWGILTVDVPDKGSKPKAPTLPDTAARSVESPQSILAVRGRPGAAGRLREGQAPAQDPVQLDLGRLGARGVADAARGNGTGLPVGRYQGAGQQGGEGLLRADRRHLPGGHERHRQGQGRPQRLPRRARPGGVVRGGRRGHRHQGAPGWQVLILG